MRRHSVAALCLTLLAGFVVLALCATPCLATGLDDSDLFVEAFNSFRNKDYLLTIERIEQLSQIYPDSPLRDISLLLLARAGLKSGNYELAAKTINLFLAEFNDNALKNTVEEELMALGLRRYKGEKLSPNKQLQVIALKTGQDRIAREKAAAERKELERLAAEKSAKESIKLAIAMPAGNQQIAAGTDGQIMFELTNNGSKREEFLLSALVAKEYGALILSAEKAAEAIEGVALSPGERFKGIITFRMPSDRMDGFKALFHLKAVSNAFNDVTFSKDALVTASAPLVRVVAKPMKSKVVRGEPVKYRLTVLNAGSLTAQRLTIGVNIPFQLDFIDAPGANYRRENPGNLAFNVPELDTGQLMEFEIDVKVSENVSDNQELRLQVEVINGQLQRKDIFTSSAIMVQGK